MRYFFLTLLVALFAFAAYQSKKQDERHEEKTSSIPPTSNEYLPLDSFRKSEVDRAILFAQLEYNYPKKILTYHHCDNSFAETVDVVKGKEYFTRVSLSVNGDTLYVCPADFKNTKSKSKTLYTTTIDLLIDFNFSKLEKAKRHG